VVGCSSRPRKIIQSAARSGFRAHSACWVNAATRSLWQSLGMLSQLTRHVQAAYCLYFVCAVLLGVGLFTGQTGATLCGVSGGLLGIGRSVLRRRKPSGAHRP
jgi:hypothetical protein